MLFYNREGEGVVFKSVSERVQGIWTKLCFNLEKTSAVMRGKISIVLILSHGSSPHMDSNHFGEAQQGASLFHLPVSLIGGVGAATSLQVNSPLPVCAVMKRLCVEKHHFHDTLWNITIACWHSHSLSSIIQTTTFPFFFNISTSFKYKVISDGLDAAFLYICFPERVCMPLP